MPIFTSGISDILNGVVLLVDLSKNMSGDEFDLVPVDDESAALLEEYDVIKGGDAIGHSEAEQIEINALLEEYDVINGGDAIGNSEAEQIEINALLEEYDVIGSVDTERIELEISRTDRVNEAFNSTAPGTYTLWCAPHLAPVPSGPPSVDLQLVPPDDDLGLTEATMAEFTAMYLGT